MEIKFDQNFLGWSNPTWDRLFRSCLSVYKSSTWSRVHTQSNLMINVYFATTHQKSQKESRWSFALKYTFPRHNTNIYGDRINKIDFSRKSVREGAKSECAPERKVGRVSFEDLIQIWTTRRLYCSTMHNCTGMALPHWGGDQHPCTHLWWPAYVSIHFPSPLELFEGIRVAFLNNNRRSLRVPIPE